LLRLDAPVSTAFWSRLTMPPLGRDDQTADR
jgi:hypothetical protein